MSRRINDRIALIVCDLDGTLLERDETLPSEMFNIAQKLQKHGIYFSVATGRNFISAENHIRLLGVEAPFALLNGALIATREGTLWSWSLPQEAVAGLADRLENSAASVVFCTEREDKVLRETEWVFSQREKHGRFHQIISGKEISSQRIFKISIVDACSQGTIADTARWLAEHYPNRLKCTLYGDREMEIVCARCDKASATRIIADALNIAMKQVMFIGDNHNDLEAVSQAGLGVAVGNAVSEIKRAADYVCKNEYSQGVREAIGTFLRNGAGLS
jgi:Cof subfamily protein (haloacid dehalogenase superfamily)